MPQQYDPHRAPKELKEVELPFRCSVYLSPDYQCSLPEKHESKSHISRKNYGDQGTFEVHWGWRP